MQMTRNKTVSLNTKQIFVSENYICDMLLQQINLMQWFIKQFIKYNYNPAQLIKKADS